MRKDTPLNKETKVKAQRLANLLNEFLEKNIKREDLSTPKKIGQYWKLLEKNLWQRKMDPPGPYCLLGSEHSDRFVDIPTLLKAEAVGSANIVLWLHQLLKSVLDKFENQEEIYDYDNDNDDIREFWEDKYDIVEHAQILSAKLSDALNFGYEIIFKADLVEFMDHLKRCKDNLCNKWFVQRSNKIFCSHGCASRYRKRIKEGKGDLQLSYRARHPNKKKVTMSEGEINGKKEYSRNI